MLESLDENDWFDRCRPPKHVVNLERWLRVSVSGDFVADVLAGPVAYQQRFIDHAIRIKGAAALPFLKELFLQATDERLKLFIIARASVCLVCVNGEVNEDVYNWLVRAVEEIRDNHVKVLIEAIRERFLDLAVVLNPLISAKLRAAS